MASPEFRLLGVRHHGVGSAKGLLKVFEDWLPDLILLEGPPEADTLLHVATLPDILPPIALLVYQKDAPGSCAFFPFADFSPEWQAIRWAAVHQVPIRMIDLAQKHWQAIPETKQEGDTLLRQDPIAWLAGMDGYPDGERWWEEKIEYQHSTDTFGLIAKLMVTLREQFPEKDSFTLLREAAMRKQMRLAEKEGFSRIAVVCGAWHVPALIPEKFPSAKTDNQLLKGLPKVNVSLSWIPWSYTRLSTQGGYGAGVRSPAWYDILWRHPQNAVQHWMAQAAQLMRREGLDTSTAQVIDAVMLAETLAQLRQRKLPALGDLIEAAQTLMLEGKTLDLIEEQLVIGDRFGYIPDEVPLTPVQQDFKQQTKKLRFKVSHQKQALELDLRKPAHLQKSYFLHRLAVLDISWGTLRRMGANYSSFAETWAIQWKSTFDMALIEANTWGNTIRQAAAMTLLHQAQQADQINELSLYLNQSILADLPEVTQHLARSIETQSADQEEVWLLINLIFPLSHTLTYNNLRQTDRHTLKSVLGILLERIFVGLPEACSHLNDEAAEDKYQLFKRFYQQLILLPEGIFAADWSAVLARLVQTDSVHGRFAGRAQRMLLDQSRATTTAVRQVFGQALSSPMAYASAWLEGFLDEGGNLLRYQTDLWLLLDAWVKDIPEELFLSILPALRRTFSQFSSEQKQYLHALAEGKVQIQDHLVAFRYAPERTTGVERVVADLFSTS